MKEIIAVDVWGESEAYWLKGHMKHFSRVLEICYIFTGRRVMWVQAFVIYPQQIISLRLYSSNYTHKNLHVTVYKLYLNKIA